MTTARVVAGCAGLLSTAVLTVAGCGSPSGPSAGGGAGPAAAPPVAEATPPPYSYPPPVSGHYEEVNTGSFDLVDGIAYPAPDGSGTVVWVVSEPIASPLVAVSACPATEARALAVLRDASYAEVTIDGRGRSSYFAYGTMFGGQSRESDSGGAYWRIEKRSAPAGRTAASVRHRLHGGFEVDLAVSRPGVTQVSENDRMQGRRTAADGPTPTEAKLAATYSALRKAALAKDLRGLLEAQGFDAATIAAVRGLPGIAAELDGFADRFLDPGTAEEPSVDAGYGGIGGRGTNSQGAAFFNYYEFAPCGERLVLISIGLNPQ
jgi:hypothetical protein